MESWKAVKCDAENRIGDLRNAMIWQEKGLMGKTSLKLMGLSLSNKWGQNNRHINM